ncbi:hypothetical protein RCO27_12455 [Sphingosinicella sp. LHD-64]|uniref:hypothetical protein n=1 Tax=Sphingosinicella sp. LHD-64 TaxID=3072139 RepID=UPI00280E4E4D|nr:hypothetical protein [Sphingosinicella sp. LHD-64]MDQ8757040.1 hypothetical protein [Sphingosinicella sp. LHD-64]
MRKLRAIGSAGGASLVAMALLLAPALAASTAVRNTARPPAIAQARPVGAFTPAVSDPRLAALLARSGGAVDADFRFTPAGNNADRNRAVRVAIRARATTPAQAQRDVLSITSASPVTAITPVSYNLGASLGWRRFAVSGDIAQIDGGVVPGRREAAQVGMSYRANRRLTGRVAVAAERAEGAQRIVSEDEAYSLDVGGAFSITRNIDLTAGARYRIARDRVDTIARDERQDSQAVYIGTAFRF